MAIYLELIVRDDSVWCSTGHLKKVGRIRAFALYSTKRRPVGRRSMHQPMGMLLACRRLRRSHGLSRIGRRAVGVFLLTILHRGTLVIEWERTATREQDHFDI